MLCPRPHCTMEDDGNDSLTDFKDPNSKRPHRPRIYPDGAKGPFVVYFRKISSPLNVLLISAELHQKFTTVKEIKKINLNKVRATFGDREQANAVIKLPRFNDLYRVYIPSDLVEIDGVIYDESIDPKEVEEHGVGKFKADLAPSVAILECERLVTREKVGEKEEYIPSRALRVTFTGTILPDFVCISQVLFRVRLYSPKLMFCERCKTFGHTAKYCSNKERCGKCGGDHTESTCDKKDTVCLFCKNTHSTMKDCAAYQSKQKEVKDRALRRCKITYAQAVRPQGTGISTSNSFSLLDDISDSEVVVDDEAHCSYIVPPRKRKKPVSPPKNETTQSQSQSTAKGKKDEQFPSLPKNGDIPGFHKTTSPNGASLESPPPTTNSPLSEFLLWLCDLFGLSSQWRNLCVHLTPLLSSLWDKLILFLPLLESIAKRNA